jgi:hypothetical protein
MSITAATVLAIALSASAFAQTQQPSAPPGAAVPAPPQTTVPAPPPVKPTAAPPGQSVPPQAAPPTASAAGTPAGPDIKITAEQAKVLFASVGEILQFVSDDSGLAIHRQVKPVLTSRDAVEKYLSDKLKNDKDAKRMERSELVLKKFGLLDQSFHLQTFLVALLKEQIAGYYDDKTKTVNLLDWIAPDEQKPVLAHELTHALQDQRVDLQKWQKVGEEPDHPAKNVKEDRERIAMDEVGTARDAVTEGQGMATLIDYSLKPMSQSLLKAPQVLPLLTAQMTDFTDSPMLARAPLLLQESLLFPYREGLEFIVTVESRKGKDAAFAGTLDRPPSTSSEIMHPDLYLAQVPQPLLTFPDVHPLLDATYSPYDVGVMGEEDVKITADLFAGQQEGSALSPAWRGGVYYAAQRKADEHSPAANTTSSLALVYVSQWTTPKAAEHFAELYERQFARKYTSLASQDDPQKIAPSEKLWTTNEGPVMVAIEGSTLFVSEGFEEPIARKLEVMMFAAQPGTGTITAQIPVDHDLTTGLDRFLQSAGTYKFALPH